MGNHSSSTNEVKMNSSLAILLCLGLTAVFAVDPDCPNDPNSIGAIVVFTEDNGEYQFLDDYGLCAPIGGQTDIAFWVKASSGAKVTLEDVKGNDQTIEIVIGGEDNTMSGIYPTHESTDGVEVAGSWLDAKAYKPFWVSWADGQVIVGTGEQIGENAFLEAEIEQTVEYIGLASDSAAASNGVWVFNMDPYTVACSDNKRRFHYAVATTEYCGYPMTDSSIMMPMPGNDDCVGTALLTASHGNPDPNGRPSWPAMDGLTMEFIGGTGAEYWVPEIYTIADTLKAACQFIIMLGDNDLDSADAREPGLIFDDIQTLVDEAKLISPYLNVIVFTVMPRPSADETDYEARRMALNQMLEEKLQGATLVDTSSVFLVDGESFHYTDNWHTDGTHMNEQGYEALQAIIATLL